MEITGKLPKIIIDRLSNVGVVTDGIITNTDDIDITITKNGTPTVLYAIYVGDGKWSVDSIEDNANLFPSLNEGDTIGVDYISKLFVSSIHSSLVQEGDNLIVSFNPLGAVAYGLKDAGTKVVDKVKDIGSKIGDFVKDRIDADQAEEYIRKSGPIKVSYIDKRDNKKKKMNYSTSDINVGKIEPLGKQGHYKVLTGNPETQDFQVWHLYRNGNKIRTVDVKTGLEDKEATWVYKNNIPKTWSKSDWNGTERNEAKEHESVKDFSEEDNVIDEREDAAIDETDNVVDEDLHEFVKDYYNDKDEEREYMIVDDEEDNVVVSAKRKKSKYNGLNVTGCAKPDGTVVMASLILNSIEDFQKYLKNVEASDIQKGVLTKILTLLYHLPYTDRKNMTKDSHDNVLQIDFSKTDLTSEKYAVQFIFTGDRVESYAVGMDINGDKAVTMCEQSLKSIIQNL